MLPLPAQVVGGMRITRKDGSYRQSFATENANRLARVAEGLQHQITISHEDDNQDAADARSGRLRVVTERSLKHNVPFEMKDGKFTYEDAPDPLNQVGALIEDNIPVVTSNDFASFVAAFAKRCDFKQLKQGDDISDDVFTEACALIDALPDNLFPEFVEDDETVARWLSKFGPEKQKRMTDAEATIAGVDAHYLGTKDLSVKIEVLLKRNDPEWAPRIIYAGNDTFNRVTGPAVMVAMERLQEYLEDKAQNDIMPNKIGAVLAKLCYKTSDVSICDFINGDPELTNCYEGDFSANDKEQRSRTALLTDLWLKKMCLPQWLRTLFLDMQCFKVQNRRFGVTSKIHYQLPTGTTLTTFRNSVYNLTMFAVSCARQKITSARACILGDDILCCTKEKFSVVRWKETVDRFKMRLKGKNVRLNGEATLLSRRLVFDTPIPFMMPLIGKALARFNARANLTDMSDSTYVAGKSLSYAYEFRHVPIMRDAFLNRFLDTPEADRLLVTLDDLTWFTRSVGYSVDQIMQAIAHEPVVIDEWDFTNWLMDTYKMGVNELEELLELTINNPRLEYIDHPAVSLLSIDW